MVNDAKPAVFIFTTAYHPFVGGAEIAIQEVAERLAKRFRFFVITARMRRDLPAREERPEGTVVRIGFGLPLDKWLLLLMGPVAFFRERSVVGMPLVWGMDVSQGALAAAVVKFFSPRTRFVLTVQYGYGGGRLRRGRFGLVGVAFRFMLGRADLSTAISNYLAREAAHFGYRRPVKLLHNGVRLEAFLRARSSPEGTSPPTVITVSRLVPKNGVDILIRALPEIRKSFPDVRCHILGSGPERPRIEELARTLGVVSAVTFFGDVPHGDVPRYLAAADVFVRPARSEGMGNAFIEALAAGLPVVGTPVEGILDIITDGKTGLFANVDDPADVAAKTIRLLRDKAFGRRLADAGRALVREQFSWDAIAAGYADVFRAAMLPRILIAAPMLPPDIGGPGAYARGLADAFSKRGHRLSVLHYGTKADPLGHGIRQAGIPLSAFLPVRLLRYAFAAWRMLGEADIAIALDPVAVGGPLALACRVRGRPFIIRIEGDALWERYVERTGDEMTLRQFYEALPRLRLNRRERAWRRMSRRVFPRAKRSVFSSRWRQEIFSLGCPGNEGRMARIEPPWPASEETGSKTQEARGRNMVVLFAGRFIRIKNLERLIRAFLAAAPAGWRLELIGEGPGHSALTRLIREAGAGDRIAIRPPLRQPELRREIASVHAFVLPSLTDVSPNVILDCIAVGTPFLLTRETGFYEALKDTGLFVDPLDEEDLVAKLSALMDPQSFAACRDRLAKFSAGHSWENVADDWLNLIRNSL